MKRASLPRILVIDDQYGRCGLGDGFRHAVGEEIWQSFVADRRAMCRNFGLVDLTGDVRSRALDEAVAEAIFCPGQAWNGSAARIENASETAVAMGRRGWPFPDGGRWALVLLDLRFSHGALNSFGDPQEGSLFGLEVILPALARDVDAELPVVILSSTPRAQNNARARSGGALDFIQRIPGAGAPPHECRRQLLDALFQHGLYRDAHGWVLGSSLATLKMLRSARRAAKSAHTVLLRGETGTGKGLLARFIHEVSDRKGRPFETFNAAQRPGELQADELFGHWKGAFTDAREDSAGLWERADLGTVFIDEVADLDSHVQLRLMQPIEERRVRRLGHPPKGTAAERPVDVRVILATNRPLETQTSIKRDFLNRINAFVIDVPPLRDRPEDIPALADRLAASLSPRWKGRLLPDAIAALEGHDWKLGNVRELRNVIERAITNFPDQDITARDLEMLSARSEPSGEGAESGPRPAWTRLVGALSTDPQDWTRSGVDSWRADLAGAPCELLAAVFLWALEVSREGHRANFTLVARILSGRERLTTMQAKRLLRRYLVADGADIVWDLVKPRLGSVEREFLERLVKPQRGARSTMRG